MGTVRNFLYNSHLILDLFSVRESDSIFLSFLISSGGARWSIRTRQISCHHLETQEKQADTFSSLAEVCGDTTVRTTVKERPRRETFEWPQWPPLAILRSFLQSEINRRKDSLASVGRHSRVGRLLYGRLVVGSW